MLMVASGPDIWEATIPLPLDAAQPFQAFIQAEDAAGNTTSLLYGLAYQTYLPVMLRSPKG